MTIFTVHAPPPLRARRGGDEVRYLFVKEGFCWPALFIPLIWLIFRRMWIVLAFYIIAVAAMGWLGQQPGLGPICWGLGLFLALLLGFEGNDLRRWSLGLRGYDLVGVVEASARDDAEIRYFAASVRPMAPPPVPPVPARLQPLPPSPPVIGLFPASGAAP